VASNFGGSQSTVQLCQQYAIAKTDPDPDTTGAQLIDTCTVPTVAGIVAEQADGDLSEVGSSILSSPCAHPSILHRITTFTIAFIAPASLHRLGNWNPTSISPNH
jgi:hypothetical protein